MGVLDTVLRKNAFRSDSLWSQKLLYRVPFLYLPFWMDIHALMRSQFFSREKLDALAKDRLQELLHDAAKLPLWQRRFAEYGVDVQKIDLDDFNRLPPLVKSDFFDLPAEDFSDSSLLSRSYRDQTSGSTGRPFEFFFDFGAELRSFGICERMLRTAVGGKRKHIISARARRKIGFAFHKSEFFHVVNYNSVQHRFDELVSIIRARGEKTILYGFASTFIELARLVEERGVDLTVGAIISTGEHVRPSDRALMERALHTHFFTNYATRELGWLGFECEHHAMHINEEWGLVQILDADGSPLPLDSEGEIVVTPFDNRIMPLIRYRVGDRGVIASTPCACGRTLRTIKLLGRNLEFVDLGDRKVSLLDLSAAFDIFSNAVRQYQIVQTGALSFTIRIVPTTLFDEAREVLDQKLVYLLHPDARLTWELVDEIPATKGGKALYFVREMSVQ